MKFILEGILDKVLIKQESINPSQNIYNGKKIYEEQIYKEIIEIYNRLNYKENEKNKTKFIISKNKENIVIICKFYSEKLYSKSYLKIFLEFEIENISADSLLLIDLIYSYLETKTQKFLQWKVTYIGEIKEKYLMQEENIATYIKEIKKVFKQSI